MLPDFPGYRPLDAIHAAILDAERQGARTFVFGKTRRGRPLLGLELGPRDAPRASVLVAGIHALEWIGVEAALATIDALLDRPPTDRKVLVFPLLNVDGYLRVQEDLQQTRRRWRRGNARGVDLNRNFPSFFGGPSLSSRLLPWVFSAGPHPLSEPETSALAVSLESLARAGHRIDRALSLHSFGPKVLYPHGGRWRAPHDLDDHRRAAEGLRARLGDDYGISQVARWVPGAFAPGMEIDFFHEHFGALSLLVECSAGGRSAQAPASYLSPFAWFNPPDPRATALRLAPAMAWFLSAPELSK